jgi:hypothetical protein
MSILFQRHQMPASRNSSESSKAQWSPAFYTDSKQSIIHLGRSTHTDPVRVQDEEGNTTCFCIYVNAGPSDNPMQNQIKLVCSGVLKPVKDSQTRTGVKDRYTQHWINHLLLRFSELKTAVPYEICLTRTCAQAQ